MYSLIKPLLFKLNTETAHSVTLNGLKIFHQLGLSKFLPARPSNPVTLMGLNFPNRVGLAAGLDKNADYVDALSSLGFGFIEIGTVTPKPQIGNPKPRLFRLPEYEALINRMGFNNKGIDYVAKQLERTQYKGILGINIGKNKETPLANAVDDYVLGFKHLCKYASYVTINISSPNTEGLRDLQEQDALIELIAKVKEERDLVRQEKYVPLVVKISPDVTRLQLEAMARVFLQQRVDGVIATNTSLQRSGVESSPLANEMGGLSGKPIQDLSTGIVRQLYELLEKQIPIIAVGGIMDKASAVAKREAGAELVQVYTGLIYRGMGLVREIA